MNNVVEKFKKGHKIHIKESLKGSFTKWCGGNVTDECILKGKHSNNPKIRKKATFADNARHFKHRLGGLLKFQEGGKNGSPVKDSWWKRTVNNIGDFMSSDTGQFIANSLLLGGMSYLNTSNTLDASNASNQANLERTYLDIMLEAMLNRILRQLQLKNQWQLAYLNGETLDNYSDVVASHIGWKEYSQALLNAERNKKMLENLLALLYGAAKSNAMIGLFGNLMLTGIGLLGSSTSSKYNAPSTSSSSLLSKSTIGKNTNPYMNVSLGPTYTAQTLFQHDNI